MGHFFAPGNSSVISIFLFQKKVDYELDPTLKITRHWILGKSNNFKILILSDNNYPSRIQIATKTEELLQITARKF